MRHFLEVSYAQQYVVIMKLVLEQKVKYITIQHNDFYKAHVRHCTIERVHTFNLVFVK